MEWLLKKIENFYWDKECQRSLYLLKEKIVSAPNLVFLVCEVEIDVHVNSSNIALGSILVQHKERKVNHLICFSRQKLSKVEHKCTTTKWEELAMVYL